LDDAQIYYADAGRGAAFIMLHAGIAHSAMWAPQVAYFQEDYRVVVYDQRGFGKTTTTTNTFIEFCISNGTCPYHGRSEA